MFPRGNFMDVIGLKRFSDEALIDEELRAERLFPAFAVDPDNKVFLCNDKTLGFVFECQPLAGGDEKINDKLEQFLAQNYPDDMTMQFMLFRSPDIEWQLNVMSNLRSGMNHPLLTPVIEDRIAFLREHTQKDLIKRSLRGSVHDMGLIQDLKLIISVKIPYTGETGVEGPTAGEMQMIQQWQQKMLSLLRSMSLAPRLMTPQDYLRLMNSLCNWAPDASWKMSDLPYWEEDKTLDCQILDPTTNVICARPDLLQLGESGFVKVLSAKRLPDATYFGEAIQYAGDLSGQNQGVKQNYAVVVNVIFPNSEKMKGALEKKRQWVTNQAYGPLLKFVPVLNDKKASFDTIYESVNKGAKPLRLTFSVLVFGKSEEDVTAASMAVQAFWATQRFALMEDKFVMLPLFRNCLPLGTDRSAIRELQRYKTMTSKEAPVLLPIFGEWKGTGTYHIALMSRNGQIMSMSLHDSSTNKNGVIAAESGSGKSFLLNEIILSYMSEGARVWVIDAGKSYKKLCESLEGDFVEFGEESRICLNPFETITNWEEEEDGIVSLVGAMASANANLSDLQIAELKRIMKVLWDERGQNMTVDDIREACISSEDPRVMDIGKQLYAFSSTGAYGRFFNGKNTADFRNDFTVLELDELQGRKHLRQVVLLQLIYQIQREMYLGERDRKKLVIIDEAWDLLKEGEVSVFMEHAYRKFRKYGGSAIIATQAVTDLYDNKVGRAIADNSANMFLLGQKKESIEMVKEKKLLVLSPAGFNILRSVYTEAGVFSEIFLITERGQGVGRLVVSDFQGLLYSTAPEDVQAIKLYQDQGLSVSDAIKSVLRDRKRA
jgi:conjugal transfer ATP-binding protein TraC